MRNILAILILLGAATLARAQAINLPNYTNAAQSPATYWVPQEIQLNPATSSISWVMVGYASKSAYTAGAQPVTGATHNYSTGANISSAQYATYFGTATLENVATQCVVAALAITDVTITNSDGSTTAVSFFAGGSQTT